MELEPQAGDHRHMPVATNSSKVIHNKEGTLSLNNTAVSKPMILMRHLHSKDSSISKLLQEPQAASGKVRIGSTFTESFDVRLYSLMS
jgi:hypothetical protein